MNDPVIQTHSLTKRYGRILAVDALSMNVPRGSIFGLLGPNGSGKTTVMSMLLGLVQPTAGDYRLFGPGTGHTEALHRVGAIVESPAFYPYLSGRQNLEYFQGVTGRRDPRELDELLDRVGLLSRAGDKYRTYSLGMKQRLGLAYALLGDPELLFLDEPTNGMDPAGMAEIRELIRGVGTAERTVLLSSHLLNEVEQVCDSVAILSRGKLIAQGNVAQLLHPQEQVRLRSTDNGQARDILSGLDWVVNVATADGFLVVTAPTDRSGELTAALSQAQVYVTEMWPLQISLEQYFLEVTAEGQGAGLTSPFLFLVKAESQKLRRRWMPWIMLALAIGVTQVPYWIVYSVDQPGFEEFLLPYSITVALGFGQGLVAILAIIWAAFVLGSEYGWGTFRTVLVRGTGRWQFLAAQFSLVAATVCIWLIAIAVATGVSSLLGGLLSGHGFATEGQWTSAGGALGKSIFAILPYIILTMFFVVLTSSAGIATGLTLGYMFIIEGAIVPLLAEFVNGFDVVADFVLGQAVAAWWGEGEGRFLNGIDDPAGPVQGFLVIVAYIVVLSAATVWLFKRRDIGGARGP